MKRIALVVVGFALGCGAPPPTERAPEDQPPLELEPIAPIVIPPLIEIECEGGPVAVLAPVDEPVRIFDTVRLDATGSLASDGGAFVGAFEFTLLAKPSDSNATLSFASSRAELQPDVIGRYRVQLDVFDVTPNGNVRSCEPAVVVIDALPPEGDLVAMLTWDHPTADLDLHTLREGGQPFTQEGDVYFSNRDPVGAPWSDDADENPELDVDDDSGFGPEMTTVRTAVVGDAWTFAVHYWSAQSDGAALTTARLRVYARGERVLDQAIIFESDQLFWSGVEVRWTEDAPLVTLIDSLEDFPRPF